MLAVRLVMVASIAIVSLSLTPAQPDSGCTAGDKTPGGSCACCN